MRLAGEFHKVGAQELLVRACRQPKWRRRVTSANVCACNQLRGDVGVTISGVARPTPRLLSNLYVHLSYRVTRALRQCVVDCCYV
jgi:hypothetical protein